MKTTFSLSLIATTLIASSALAAPSQQGDVWYTDAKAALENAKKQKPIEAKPKT